MTEMIESRIDIAVHVITFIQHVGFVNIRTDALFDRLRRDPHLHA